jgi:serine/threonine-protein kinase
MLLHEARIAATLTHANIVQIFDVGHVDGTYYIAMEHVHGEDLRGIVRQMRTKGVIEFPLEHAIEIMLGVTSGLAYAHEKRDLDGSPLNIVHRDISPQNVIVTFSGDVKVVDFGIAKSDTKMTMETQSGKLKGKVPYMSPEQAKGQQLDASSRRGVVSSRGRASSRR